MREGRRGKADNTTARQVWGVTRGCCLAQRPDAGAAVGAESVRRRAAEVHDHRPGRAPGAPAGPAACWRRLQERGCVRTCRSLLACPGTCAACESAHACSLRCADADVPWAGLHGSGRRRVRAGSRCDRRQAHAASAASACAAQGNGHERDKIHFDDADTFILDAYNSDIWPNDRKARAAIDEEVLPALQCGRCLYLQRHLAHSPMLTAGHTCVRRGSMPGPACSAAGALQKYIG